MPVEVLGSCEQVSCRETARLKGFIKIKLDKITIRFFESRVADMTRRSTALNGNPRLPLNVQLAALHLLYGYLVSVKHPCILSVCL